MGRGCADEAEREIQAEDTLRWAGVLAGAPVQRKRPLVNLVEWMNEVLGSQCT